MSITLKPYPEYKDPGVRWLGQIPKHWQVLRIKNIFWEMDERSDDGKGILLSLTRTRGLLPQTEATNRLASAEDLSKYKVCKPCQLVMNRMQAWSGMFAVASQEGLVSPDYSVFSAGHTIEMSYFEHLFKSPIYIDQFAQYSKGIGSGFNRLYTPDFGAIPLVLPPREEQERIVDFLTYFDRRMNHLVRTKRRLIDLLNEQKQTIIHRAVTCGLDPNVRLKPSGLDWLGDVPEHWEVGALRRFWEVVDCKHLTVPFVEDGIPLASVVEAQSFDLDLTHCKRTTAEWYQHLVSGGRKPKRGDLIYCRNTSVGACAYVDTDVDFAMGQDVCLITSGTRNQRYLNYLLHSRFMVEQLERLLVGSTFKRINISNIRTLVVLVPPRSEEDSICRELDERVAEIANATRRVNREIHLLREYRTRLIADVVTGKLDVHGVELPALDETDALDGIDTSEDAEVNDTGTMEETIDE